MRKRRAGRRTGEKTHRGEYRGHIARWEGSEPARVAPGRGSGSLRWARALRGSVQATETERRPKGSRGSARSRPETAATSGSEGLERGVGPSTALSLRARSVRRGVTARAFLRFSPRRGGDVTEVGREKRTRRIEPSDAREAPRPFANQRMRRNGITYGNQSGRRLGRRKKDINPRLRVHSISSTTISRDLSTVRHDEAQGDRIGQRAVWAAVEKSVRSSRGKSRRRSSNARVSACACTLMKKAAREPPRVFRRR